MNSREISDQTGIDTLRTIVMAAEAGTLAELDANTALGVALWLLSRVVDGLEQDERPEALEICFRQGCADVTAKMPKKGAQCDA